MLGAPLLFRWLDRISWRREIGTIRSVPKQFAPPRVQKDGSPVANDNALDRGNSGPRLAGTWPTFAEAKRCCPATSTFSRPRQSPIRCASRNLQSYGRQHWTVPAHFRDAGIEGPVRHRGYQSESQDI